MTSKKNYNNNFNIKKILNIVIIIYKLTMLCQL